YRALPPNPLAGAGVIFPNVVQEAGRLSTLRTVSKASKKEQVAIRVDPTLRSPARAGNVRRCGVRCGVRDALCSVHAVLVGQVAARNPRPLARDWIELPQIIKNRPNLTGAAARAGRIQTETAKEPGFSGGINPEDRRLAAAGRKARTACSDGSRVGAVLVGRRGTGD